MRKKIFVLFRRSCGFTLKWTRNGKQTGTERGRNSCSRYTTLGIPNKRGQREGGTSAPGTQHCVMCIPSRIYVVAGTCDADPDRAGAGSNFSAVLWFQIHWILILIQNFDPILIRIRIQVGTGTDPDPDPGLCYQFWKKKNLNFF